MPGLVITAQLKNKKPGADIQPAPGFLCGKGERIPCGARAQGKADSRPYASAGQ